MDSTTICNMALSAIGSRSRIVAITEQSPEAAECNLHYGQTLVELLRLHPWRFARRNSVLAVLKAREGTPENPVGSGGDEPEWPWLYSYAYPNDAVKLRYIIPQATNSTATIGGIPLTTAQQSPADIAETPAVRWIEAGDVDENGQPIKVILTNQYQARMVHTALVTDPQVWDALFVTAYIGRLAGKICFNLNGDKSLLKMAMQSGKVAEEEAKAASGNEGVTVQDWQPEAQAAAGFYDPTTSSDYVSVVRQEID